MGFDGIRGFYPTPPPGLAKCRVPRHEILSLYIIWIGFFVNQIERLLRICRKAKSSDARGRAPAFFVKRHPAPSKVVDDGALLGDRQRLDGAAVQT